MQKIRGFTTVELLVTLVISAILVTMAAPSFVRLIKSNSVSGAVNALMADLRYARSESIRRGGRVVVCRSDDPEAAAPVCASAANATKGWATGWLIFEDRDNSGTYNTGDNLLRVQPKQRVGNIVDAGNTTKFQFTAGGRLLSTASTTSLTFGDTTDDASLKRVLCIPISGRVRIAGDGTATCGGTTNE